MENISAPQPRVHDRVFLLKLFPQVKTLLAGIGRPRQDILLKTQNRCSFQLLFPASPIGGFLGVLFNAKTGLVHLDQRLDRRQIAAGC